MVHQVTVVAHISGLPQASSSKGIVGGKSYLHCQKINLTMELNIGGNKSKAIGLHNRRLYREQE